MKRARAMLMGAVLTVVVASTMSTAPSAAMADQLGDWSDATRVEDAPGTDPAFNGPSLDGCPFISPDSKSFYMASNRVAPGSQGGIDIWVSARASADDPWGAPVNLGPGINSPQNDFCPTLLRVEPAGLLRR
jgi:hypothetical protein